MDYFNKLENKLKTLLNDSNITPITKILNTKSTTIFKLRDAILTVGDVIEEDLESNLYVASVKTGLCKLGRGYIAAQIVDGDVYVVSYSKEGLINQHMAENSIILLENAINKETSKKKSTQKNQKSNKKSKSKKKTRVLFFCIVGVILALIITMAMINTYVLSPFIKETKNYNLAVQQYNAVAEEYNQKSNLAFLENITGFDNKAPKLDIVSYNVNAVIKSLLGGNTTQKIKSDVLTLNSLTFDLSRNVDALDNIINPNESFVSSRLMTIDGIISTGCVTMDNDPNQMLGKEGGYTGCVYFSSKEINDEALDAQRTIEQGTDGGGAVEIFATKEDALARCDYLEQFKDTILYSGSYAAVGTIVVRTSYQLTDEQQYKLTSSIVENLLSTSNQ